MEANEGWAADRLHEWLFEDGPFDGEDREYLWGDSEPSRAFVVGFVKGALEVWGNVKDRVRN